MNDVQKMHELAKKHGAKLSVSPFGICITDKDGTTVEVKDIKNAVLWLDSLIEDVND